MNKFPFFIVRMYYLSSNIPSSLFCGSILSEFQQIAQCSLNILSDFVPKASQLYQLYTRIVTQGRNKVSIQGQIKKKHSEDTRKHFLSIVRHMTK